MGEVDSSRSPPTQGLGLARHTATSTLSQGFLRPEPWLSLVPAPFFAAVTRTRLYYQFLFSFLPGRPS